MKMFSKVVYRYEKYSAIAEGKSRDDLEKLF